MVGFRGVLVGCVFLLLFHSAFQQQQQQSRLSSPQEFQALLRLRSSLGIRSREWPIKADPCTIWVGVECRNGSVFSINVSGFRRTRIGSQNPQFAVDALANFTRLASFNASSFSLPGPIPNWLGLRVSSLQILDLSSCNIVGEIPSSIGNLSSLTALYLSGNALNGSIPSAVGQLSRLLVLDLSSNSLTGLIPSALGGQLSSLSVLDLSHNSLTGLIPLSLGALGNVSRLDLSSNYLSGTIPTAFGNLSRLQSLNLSGNSLSGSIPPQLGDLSRLVDLDLSSNSFSGSVPSDLGGLRSLQGMVIGNNLLTGSLPGGLFSSLNQLQVVGLNRNNFTGELPGALWSLPGLRILDASDNNFTGLLPNISFNPNSSAATLNLSHNLFYGGIGSVLRRFSSVDLTDNYIEGTIPDYASNIALLSSNCLWNVASQKNVSQCAAFYAERGLPYDGLLPNGTEPIARNRHKSSRRWIILAAAIAGAVVFAFVVTLLFLCTRKRGTTTQRGVGVGPVPTTVGAPPPPGVSLNLSSLGEAFTYQQILAAAGEFGDDNLVKHGHSGDIFRGVLEGGIPIIIKRIDVRNVKKDNYMLELDFFSKISHPRLVPLLGHCLENENEKFLVYKYMPYMDLSSSLYRKNNSDDDALQSLDWITRLKIAIGAAEGLSYLHHECTPPLVHRDVQASSILLDDKFEVRLGSLSEVCTQEGETHSNRFTRMLRLPQTSEQGSSGTSTATCAYDVYCFGKVLLELVTGKLGLSASSDPTTKDMLEQTLPFISIYDKELVTNIVDPSLIIDEDLLEEVWAMAVVARSCLNPKPSRRPLMRYILKALENPLKVVREETTSSARLRTTSSRGSWNAALFGSWRQSSSDVAAMPVVPTIRGEGTSSFKQSGTTGSQGSGHNGDHSSSTRRHSKDIFPEPLDEQDVERQREG